MVEHQDVLRIFLRQSVARGFDGRDDLLHAVVVGSFADRVAQRSVRERHQIQQFGAERVAGERIVGRRDQRFEVVAGRLLRVDARGDQKRAVQIGIDIQRLVGVLVGVAVIKVVVVVGREGRVARIVPQHQVGVVVGRFRIHRPVDDPVFVGCLGECRPGQHREQQEQFSHGRQFIRGIAFRGVRSVRTPAPVGKRLLFPD